jgi:hypothetical protein
MPDPQDKEKFTQEVIVLQNLLTQKKITQEEFETQVKELRVKHLKNVESEPKFKIELKEEKDTEEEVKEAKVIEVVKKDYSRRSAYSIDEINKKIDRLDSERVERLRDRYKDKYGEDLYVPDLHSENVRTELEDVKPYLDVDTTTEKKDDKEGKKEEEKPKEDSGPSFFTRLINSIKAFFSRLFSSKKKSESPSTEAVVVADGE